MSMTFALSLCWHSRWWYTCGVNCWDHIQTEALLAQSSQLCVYCGKGDGWFEKRVPMMLFLFCLFSSRVLCIPGWPGPCNVDYMTLNPWSSSLYLLSSGIWAYVMTLVSAMLGLNPGPYTCLASTLPTKLHPLPKNCQFQCFPEHAWSPEVNIKCPSPQLPTLVFEMEPLIELWHHCFREAGCPGSHCNSLVPSMLGYRCVLSPIFMWVLES